MNAQDHAPEDIAFLECVMRFQDGALTPEEIAALEREMMASPEKRRLFTGAQLLSTSIHERLRQEAYRPAEKPRQLAWLPWRPLTAATAGLVLVAILGAVLLLPQTSAAAIVRRALKAHAAALDRCYRVEFNHEIPLERNVGPVTAQERRLWTRGDRFWIESRTGEQTVAWGRDERGCIWFAFSPESGSIYEPDEVGKYMARFCELRSLQVESLLRFLLADFDLRREPDSTGNQLIHAQLKAGHTHPIYRAALLEVDAESGVLRRVVLHHMLRGHSSAVTFTLLETSLLPDNAYTLAGHLTPQAVVYDRRNQPDKRTSLFGHFRGTFPGSDTEDSR